MIETSVWQIEVVVSQLLLRTAPCLYILLSKASIHTPSGKVIRGLDYTITIVDCIFNLLPVEYKGFLPFGVKRRLVSFPSATFATHFLEGLEKKAQLWRLTGFTIQTAHHYCKQG